MLNTVIFFRGGDRVFAAPCSRIAKIRIVNSGGEQGVAIDVTSETE